MLTPSLARIELDRFWVNPGDKILAMHTFWSTGPLDRPLDVAVVLRPADRGPEIDCSFSPCFPVTQWPEGVFVREGLFAIEAPANAQPGEYEVMVALRDMESGSLVPLANADGGYCRACGIEIAEPRWVGRREPLTADLLEDRGERREPPREPIVLRNPDTEVILDAADGLPFRFRASSGGTISGAPTRSPIVAAVHRLDPRASIAREVRPSTVTADGRRAEFRFDLPWTDRPAASFSLVYELDGPTISVTLEDLREEPGFELMQVGIPGLASVTASDSAAWLAYAEDGGQLIDLADVRGGRLRATTEWRFSAPVAMIGCEGVLATLEVPTYMDTTELTATPAAACLATTKVVRTPGGPATTNLRSDQPSLCRLHVLGGENVDWLDAAKMLRRNMPPLLTRYYDTHNTYKIFCQCPPSAPVTTFEQAAQLIRDFAALTDGFPQAAYLVGWQYGGHDTGYPAVDVVNCALGGEEGLRTLMQAGAEVDCAVSFHDNYDDAYTDSPDWDPDFIARYPDSTLMKGGWWAGGQSWIIGMANYARSRGWDRAVHTCRKYDIRDTYHIDVLSAEALRPDWNPDHPASAYANLMGKYRIIDAFASCGVDVTTEGVSWPFIGKTTWFNALVQADGDRFGGERPIPLVQALYRQCARWGGSGGGGEAVLRSLYKGCCFGTEITAAPGRLQSAIDAFYLVQVPWLLMRDLPLESYERRGNIDILGYGPNTTVKLDWASNRYAITVDGVEIGRDFATFCPLGEDRIAFYSLEDRELSAPLLRGWDPNAVCARLLGVAEDPVEVPVETGGGELRVNVPARSPVIVYRAKKL